MFGLRGFGLPLKGSIRDPFNGSIGFRFLGFIGLGFRV